MRYKYYTEYIFSICLAVLETIVQISVMLCILLCIMYEIYTMGRQHSSEL
jgi:hypothetical protein